jgi:nucleotide-binding universal stress UspA family protein
MPGWLKNKILVPIDFSDVSFRALDAALEIVADEGEITVLHVLQDLHPAEYGELYQTVTPKTREQHVRDEFKKRLAEPRYGRIQLEIRFDDPGHGIAEFAKQTNST